MQEAVLFLYYEELRFRRIRRFVWTQMKSMQENSELPPDLSSATQKDVKPMTDHMGEAFESHPGIPVSGKTGQRGSCSYSVLSSLRRET